MKFHDFGSPVDSDEVVMFKIYGSEFHCVPAIQGTRLVELMAVDINDPIASSKAMMDFFNEVLVPKDLERFQKMTSSKTHIVPMPTLASIMEWLIETYAGGRPTTESPDSSTGQEDTGSTSAATS